MRLVVNGVTVPMTGKDIAVQVEVDPAGEILPFVTVDITGGKLEVYRSRHSVSGNYHLNFFGATNMMDWPTLEQAQEAADLVCDNQDQKPNCCDHDTCMRACWIVHGYALSQCSAPCEMKASAHPDGRKALEALRASKGMKAININWQALIQFVLQLLTILGPILTPPAPAPTPKP